LVSLLFDDLRSLLINRSLLFDTVSVLDELIVHLVFNEAIQGAASDDIVTLGNLVSETASSHEFDDNWLRCVDPIRLQLLITNAVKQHFLFLGPVRRSFTRQGLQVAFVEDDLSSDFAVEASVQLGQMHLSLTRFCLLHSFNLCKLFTVDLGRVAEVGGGPLLHLE